MTDFNKANTKVYKYELKQCYVELWGLNVRRMWVAGKQEHTLHMFNFPFNPLKLLVSGALAIKYYCLQIFFKWPLSL